MDRASLAFRCERIPTHPHRLPAVELYDCRGHGTTAVSDDCRIDRLAIDPKVTQLATDGTIDVHEVKLLANGSSVDVSPRYVQGELIWARLDHVQVDIPGQRLLAAVAALGLHVHAVTQEVGHLRTRGVVNVDPDLGVRRRLETEFPSDLGACHLGLFVRPLQVQIQPAFVDPLAQAAGEFRWRASRGRDLIEDSLCDGGKEGVLLFRTT